MFRRMFKTRDLKSSNEIINVYNDVAWVEFYWVFDAWFSDGKANANQGKRNTDSKKDRQSMANRTGTLFGNASDR